MLLCPDGPADVFFGPLASCYNGSFFGAGDSRSIRICWVISSLALLKINSAKDANMFTIGVHSGRGTERISSKNVGKTQKMRR